MKETYFSIPGCSLSFALLTDMHNKPMATVIASLRAHKPQAILIAGDIIYGAYRGESLVTQAERNILPALTAFASIAPTFLSLGNHERILCEKDYELIRETGITILDNEWIEQGGISIGGLTSGYVLADRKIKGALHSSDRYPKLPPTAKEDIKPDTSWLHDFAASNGYHILLSHHPEFYPLIPPSVELVLSGHAHGGQWDFYSFRDRRWKGIFAPGQGFFPKYTSGMYGRMIVSRGLANTTWVPRICNPTEVVYVNC